MSSFKNSFSETLEKDVNEGFHAAKKFIRSKYFYDAHGDLLFRRITNLPEYYLTACEKEILVEQGKDIFRHFDKSLPLNVIELGSGDGAKARMLFESPGREFTIDYYPVDISPAVLKLAEENTSALVKVHPVPGDYAEVLSASPFPGLANKLILFLGSNIGNFSADETSAFMAYLSRNMRAGDCALIGFDLVKDEKVILDAYNDPTGLTAEFNLNLLTILNRELKGDFEPSNFYHAPVYDPVEKAAKSYLISNKKQTVFFEKTFKSFSFEKGEAIFTEISSKYTPGDINDIAAAAGLEVVNTYNDSRNYFSDVLLRKPSFNGTA